MSCHDSGIDIRDPNPPVVQPMPSKKVYSDADIVLSSDWVPPITIAPTNVTDSLGTGSATNGRKKHSSVSFDVKSNVEDSEDHREDDKQEQKEDDKQETRKNKVYLNST